MNGWIKLHRKLLDNPIFQDAHLLQVFIYCLLKANHKDEKVLFNGQVIDISKGSFVTGRHSASNDMKLKSVMWNRKIEILEKLQILNKQVNNQFTIIKICKWQDYQGFDTNNEQQMNSGMNSGMNNKRTTDEQRMNTNKNEENEKKEEGNTSLAKARFEEIWGIYPKRIGKKEAQRHFTATVKNDEDWEKIKQAFINYNHSKRVKEGFIQNGSTWFNNWQDWVNYTEDGNGTKKTDRLI